MPLPKRRLRLGGGLLALTVAALIAVHPSPVRGDQIAGQASHGLDSHQYKDSRKCLLTAAAALGCFGGQRTAAMAKRHADKRQRTSSDRDNDLGPNGNNFDYNYDGGGGDDDDGVDGGNQDGGPEAGEDYYDPPLITDPRDRMVPVIYNPRPVYVPPPPPPPPSHQQQQQHHQQRPQPYIPPPSQYNRYNEDIAQINPFEVPIIECPLTEDGFERFACPTPDKEGRFKCIDDHVLCDGYIDCPNGDDEDRKNCFFFKTTKAHLDILADALLRWARGR